MAVNWPEIAVQTVILLVIIAMVGAYVWYRQLPKLKAGVAQWVGAAIGRFMQSLADDAEAEGVEGVAMPGHLKIGGFEIDVGTIKELIGIAPQLIQLAKMFGLLGGGGSGGSGENPFLK